MTQLADLQCRIFSGAFPAERVYQVEQADGSIYEGGAPDHYFRNANGDPLEFGEPGPGGSIGGTISVLVVSNGRDIARVALPDNDAIIVKSSQLAARATESERVPV